MGSNQKEHTFTVQVHRTNGETESISVECFTDLQDIVGGYIEVVFRNGTDLLVNEDGVSLGLPMNPKHKGIVGDVIEAPKGWADLPYRLDTSTTFLS